MDILLLDTMDTFCTPNCTQTILISLISIYWKTLGDIIHSIVSHCCWSYSTSLYLAFPAMYRKGKLWKRGNVVLKSLITYHAYQKCTRSPWIRDTFKGQKSADTQKGNTVEHLKSGQH